MRSRFLSTPFLLSAVFVGTMITGCTAQVDEHQPEACALDGTSCGVRPRAELALLQPPPAQSGGDGWGAPEAPPSPRACPNAYEARECRWPGMPLDVRGAQACCGSVTEDARCCAAKGQPCSNEVGQTCCNGLKCGATCTCE